MMRRLARTRSEVLPLFATVTYPDGFTPEPARWKRDLDALLKRLRRLFRGAAGFWKLELKARQSGQSTGQLAPHFHLLLWGVPLAWEDPKGRQLHWRFDLQAHGSIVNGRRLFKREVFENGECVVTERWGMAAAGRVEVRSRKRLVKRHGEVAERETVEWWEHDGVAHLDGLFQELGACGVGCGRVELREWLSLAWFDIVGSEDLAHLRAGTNVEQVRSSRGVMFYASKYIAKSEESASPVGRWWGSFNAGALPWAEPVEMDLGPTQAARLRRTARRYVNRRRKKGRRWHPRGSCAWFCQASGWLQWVRKLCEPADALKVEAVARRPEPLHASARTTDGPVFKPSDVEEGTKIVAAVRMGSAQSRASGWLGGFG